MTVLSIYRRIEHIHFYLEATANRDHPTEDSEGIKFFKLFLCI
jgi:hypothetical protein